MTDQELIGSVGRLITETRALRRSVEELGARTVRSETDIHRSKRAIRWTIIGVALDILLTIVAAFLFNDQRATSSRLDEQQARSVQVQREVLCPLWVIFLKSYDPKSPAALRDPAAYEANFRTIRRGVAILDCGRKP